MLAILTALHQLGCEEADDPSCSQVAAFLLPNPGDMVALRGQACPEDIEAAWMSIHAYEIPDTIGVTVSHIKSGEPYEVTRDLMLDYASVGFGITEDVCARGIEIVISHNGDVSSPAAQGQLSFAVSGSWPRGCELSLEVDSP